MLKEETLEDRDYYISRATIDLLASGGEDAEVVDLLRSPGRSGDMDVRWEPV